MNSHICKTETELPEYMFADIVVPAGLGMYAGEVYFADELEASIGNISGYTPETVADVETEDLCLILNGTFEQTPDRRKPKGNPNYGTYKFRKGDIATALRLNNENVKIEISLDALFPGETPIVGNYLIPQNGSNYLAYTDDLETTKPKYYLLIEASNYFKIGGEYGEEYVPTLICRVIKYQNPALVDYIVKFDTIPTDTTIVVKNEDDEIQIPDAFGNYKLIPGNYTYSASADGYIPQDNIDFAVADNITIEVELDAIPEITEFDLTVEPDLKEGETNVAAGATVGTMSVVGGTEPFVYTFNTDPVEGADNGSFVIDGSNLNVGTTALTQKDYKVSLKVIDDYSQEATINKIISVAGV